MCQYFVICKIPDIETIYFKVFTFRKYLIFKQDDSELA